MVPSKEAAYLTPDQVRSLLVAAEGSRYAPLFALGANSGLRRGEALALHWSDIDFGAEAAESTWHPGPSGRRARCDRNQDSEVTPSHTALPHG